MPETGRQWRRLEQALGRTDLDFSGRMVAVNTLAGRAADAPDQVRISTVGALSALLCDGRHLKETQALAFFRAAAGALAGIAGCRRSTRQCRQAAREALLAAMKYAARPGRRAAAEALGGLPLAIRGPDPPSPPQRAAAIGWKTLLKQAGVSRQAQPAAFGRSRVFAAAGRLLVVKEARTEAGCRLLAAEAAWMVYLRAMHSRFTRRFDIPEPITLPGGHLFSLDRIGTAPDPGRPRKAIAFFAHADYFRYPNEPGVDAETLVEVLARNSWLLGRLAGLGIVHTAPIPLFHNRAQAHRRADGGIYEWPRAGRLDRWLSSSRYPNISAAGLRDFEHLTPVRRSRRPLFLHVGTHLIGLMLVAASYFRRRDLARVGRQEDGRPCDARELFDPVLLKRLIHAVLAGYFEGFVGRGGDGTHFDLDLLAARMIEEMGVDRHMEEVFRVADQQRLTEARFRRVLADGGLSPERIRRTVKGRADITLLTGPHLGGFNGRISIPELIECVQRAAALCISERFRDETEAA